jgi:MFS family permease
MLMGFASISTDLYLPAMTVMGLSLHADTGMIEWTISGYLIGFSSGQLLWGLISDRYGRRLAVGSGLILLFGTIAAMCAGNWSGFVAHSGFGGLWADGTPRPLGLVIAISGLGCLPSMLLLIPSRNKKYGLFAVKGE